MEIVFRKGINEDEIREEIRELIEDKLGIEIVEIN